MQYSISDLEQLSGVQSHTIRMWEQRYNVLTPNRSAGNTRFYSDEDLVKLLNIVSINQRGLKISKISTLSQSEIYELIDEDINDTISKDQQFELYITQLLNYGMAYNERAFEALLSKCIKQHSLTQTYISVIYPMLVRLGLMWRKDSICAAQEHFLTSIIRQKLYVAINELPLAKEKSNTWLLYLPEDEEHEIGILFANFLLRQAGLRVIYLGSRVPLDSVKQVVERNKIDNIMLFMIQSKLAIQAQNYISELANTFKNIGIHISGNSNLLKEVDMPHQVKYLKGISDFENLIADTTC